MGAAALLGDAGYGPMCNDLPYDEDSTNGTLLLARQLAFPHGWSIDEAIEFPLRKVTHDGALDWIRLEGSYDPNHYLARQAALCWWIYIAAPWSVSTRKGASWALMIIGAKVWHGCAVDHHRALEVMYPEHDQFERWRDAGGYVAMLAAMDAAFLPSVSETHAPVA